MKRRRIALRVISGLGLACASGMPWSVFAQGSAGSSSGAGTKPGSGTTSGTSPGSGSDTGTGAGSGAKLAESDPQAVALGYKDDTTRVDQKKYPNHQTAQVCSGCQFYQGTAKDALAPCTIFAGKKVAAKGWCSSYIKKVGNS